MCLKIIKIFSVLPFLVSSSADDRILSSLSYRLPNAEENKGDTLVKSGSMHVSQDWQRDNSLDSESEEVKVDHFTQMKSELMWNVEINGQQHVDDLTEDQGASIEVMIQSKPHPADTIKKSLPCETVTGPSNVVPWESLDAVQEQMCKRSSLVKKCSICREIFTWSNDLMSHMRCHTEQSPYVCSYCGKDYDNYEDYETHRIDKCRVSQQHSQDNPLSNAKKSKQENPVVSSGTSQVPAITDGPANSQAVQPHKSRKCQKCEQVFTYYKNLERHQSKCSERVSKRKKQKYLKYFIIKGCHFQSADNTNGRCDETSSDIAKTPISADDANTSQAKTVKCNMC